MQSDKEIYSDREHNNQPLVWMLPGTNYPNNFFIRQHELDCADLFVAFYPHLSVWESEWGAFEKQAKVHIKYRLNFDRRMTMPDGKVFVLEVDRGTEDLDKQLEPKIDKYIAFSNANPSYKFQVVITLQKYRRMDLGNRAGRVLAMLQEKRRGNQFIVASHTKLVKDPFGKVCASPLAPEVPIGLGDV